MDRYGLPQNNPKSEAWISLIGTLERFVPIHVGGQDHLDPATVWVDPTEVRSGFVYLKHGKLHFFSASMPTVPARIGRFAGKAGRTMQPMVATASEFSWEGWT